LQGKNAVISAILPHFLNFTISLFGGILRGFTQKTALFRFRAPLKRANALINIIFLKFARA